MVVGTTGLSAGKLQFQLCSIFLLCFSRSMNEIKNLHYLPRASEPREVLFEDRTKAHADHVGQSFDWQSTAAVGVLKAVHFGEGYIFLIFGCRFVFTESLVAHVSALICLKQMRQLVLLLNVSQGEPASNNKRCGVFRCWGLQRGRPEVAAGSV